MAEDGTGGLVYLKQVDGVAHVFVSRYVAATGWRRSGSTRRALRRQLAAHRRRDGGELVVVWATPFATENEHGRTPSTSCSARRSARASSTSARRHRRSRTSVKRVGDQPRPGDELDRAGRRRLSGGRRKRKDPAAAPGRRCRAGARRPLRRRRAGRTSGAINRDLGVSMRPPTAANAPQIAIGPTGNGDRRLAGAGNRRVARIWARRVFRPRRSTTCCPSARRRRRRADQTDADAPSVAISLLGQAEVAYRQAAAPGSPLPGPRIFLNTLPDGESESGAEFHGAVLADNDVSGGQLASVGRPSIDVDEHRFLRLLYDDNGDPRVVEGTDRGLLSALSLGPRLRRFVGDPGERTVVASTMDPEGGGISAWPSADTAGGPRRSGARGLPGRRGADGARRAAAPVGRSTNSRLGARGSATGSSPSSRGRPATPRSSPTR